ncbi:unnamed protein product [Diamesa tonsa]
MGDCTLGWKAEAKAVVEDVKYHVINLEISEETESKTSIYMNLTTLEGNKLRLMLSMEGFRVTGTIHNCCEIKEEDEVYETIYALLQTHSPKYVNSFATSLAAALSSLKRE